ncbi:MAG: hypothetical protein HZA17_12435 [Nitrospirae bacterium]|nr:hypothetical protein [Nitrospirota bacterium]
MDTEGVKIYGLCIGRLKHQISKARQRLQAADDGFAGPFLLESYTTGDIGEIMDILELYDLKEKTQDLLREKLEELAYTVSVLLREEIAFDYTAEGHLGLYLEVRQKAVESLSAISLAA